VEDTAFVREPKLLGFALDSQAEEGLQTYELLAAVVFCDEYCDEYVDCLHDHPNRVRENDFSCFDGLT